MRAHTGLDRRGETAAALSAERRGVRVLARNWRGGGGELDLVLDDGGVVVFCEVKTRSGASHGSGLEAVTRTKQRRMTRAALAFLAEKGLADRACRFDVAVVVPSVDRDACRVEWLRGALEAVSDEGECSP